MPEGYSGGDRYVEGVLGAALRDFEADVGAVYYGLVYAVYFVAEHKGVFGLALGLKAVEGHAAVHLLEAYDGISVGGEGVDGFCGSGVVVPVDRFFGAEGCFVDFGRRGSGRDSARHHGGDGKGVAGAENSTYIIERANVVEHHHHGYLGSAVKLLDGKPPHFPDCLFLHNANLLLLFGFGKRKAL